MKFLDSYKQNYAAKKKEVMTVEEYLKAAKADPSYYASIYSRLLSAIGEPELIDTANDPRLSRIYGHRIIRRYAAFKDFYGADATIESFIKFLKAAEQGLEEKNQIFYLLGPVGGGKSSLAECIKGLAEQCPIYVLAYVGQEGLDKKLEHSPVWESPVGLFPVESSEELGISARHLKTRPSAWAVKRLGQAKGDLSHFRVVKCYPSLVEQRAMSTVVAGDENNQDISTLVGKGSLRKIEFYEQNDPDCYSYCGGLCTGNQGVLEFVEMFKANMKTLYPLLTATQEHYYEPVEKIGLLPFDGLILAHSNETEWNLFKSNKENEAMLDRVHLVEVPYCTRVSEEVKIYKKLLRNSALIDAPCAPKTLELLAEFCVLSRLDPVEDRNNQGQTVAVVSPTKMKVYDGESMKEKDVSAKTIQEYKDKATRDEGFHGISTRDAFQILSKVYNFEVDQVSANPVHLFTTLKDYLVKERVEKTLAERYLTTIKQYLEPQFKKEVTKHMQIAYLDCYEEFGQTTMDRYLVWADHWVDDNDFRDPDTGQMSDRSVLNDKLEKLEKPAGISNPKDFRNEVVKFALKYQARNDGKKLGWKEYPALRKVIEANMFNKMEDLLPIISFGGHQSKDDAEKHKNFVARMVEQGYTENDVKLVVDWVEGQKHQ